MLLHTGWRVSICAVLSLATVCSGQRNIAEDLQGLIVLLLGIVALLHLLVLVLLSLHDCSIDRCSVLHLLDLMLLLLLLLGSGCIRLLLVVGALFALSFIASCARGVDSIRLVLTCGLRHDRLEVSRDDRLLLLLLPCVVVLDLLLIRLLLLLLLLHAWVAVVSCGEWLLLLLLVELLLLLDLIGRLLLLLLLRWLLAVLLTNVGTGDARSALIEVELWEAAWCHLVRTLGSKVVILLLRLLLADHLLLHGLLLLLLLLIVVIVLHDLLGSLLILLGLLVLLLVQVTSGRHLGTVCFLEGLLEL